MLSNWSLVSRPVSVQYVTNDRLTFFPGIAPPIVVPLFPDGLSFFGPSGGYPSLRALSDTHLSSASPRQVGIGPSGGIRTRGLVVPNHARCQLRYTRMFLFSAGRRSFLRAGRPAGACAYRPFTRRNRPRTIRFHVLPDSVGTWGVVPRARTLCCHRGQPYPGTTTRRNVRFMFAHVTACPCQADS